MGYFTKVDLAHQSKLVSGDTANYQGSISLSSLTTSGIITMESNNPSYYSTFLNSTNTNNSFEIQNGGQTILKSSEQAYGSIYLGHLLTQNTNLNGALTISGKSFNSLSGTTIGNTLNQTLYPIDDNNTLIGLDVNPVFNTGNKIGTIDTLIGGTGYTDGVYSGITLQNIIGGGPVPTTANLTIAGGVIIDVGIVNAGAGYNIGDILGVNANLIGLGTGIGFQFRVASTVPYTGITQYSLRTNGLDVYANDYSAQYTDRTKIDKGYADLHYAPISVTGGTGGGSGTTVTASNGLTKSGNNIVLGGTLTGGTTIDTTDSNFFVISDLTNPSSTVLLQLVPSLSTGGGNYTLNAQLSDGTTGSYLGGSSSELDIIYYTTGGTSGFQISSAQFSISDSINNIGMQYVADYSANGTLNPRWVPDYGAVLTAIGGNPLTFQDGIVNNSGIVGLGGSLTQDIHINQTSVYKLYFDNNDIYVHTLRIGLGNNNDTSNIAIGAGVLANNTTFGSGGNLGIGNFVLNGNTSGYNNTGVGYQTLGSVVTGYTNTALGAFTLASTTGSENTGIGYQVFENYTTGSQNTAVGSQAGGIAASSGSGNIFIGFSAGANETGDNKLYIANSSTSTPLIGGDFSANTLNFQAKITTTDTINNFGMQYASDYSVNGTLNDRWIPDWGAVKTAAFTFQDGIVNNSGVVGLGGTFTQDITIDGVTHAFIFQSTYATVLQTRILAGYGDVEIQASRTDNAASASFVAGGDNINMPFFQMVATDASSNTQYIASWSNLDPTTTGIAVWDNMWNTGFLYKDDYSANGKLNDRWIPDWGAVKSYISGTTYTLTTTGNTGPATLGGGYLNIPQYTGTTYTANNGLTLSNNNITLGGALTGNTLITLSAYTLGFSGDVQVNGLTLGKGLGNISSNVFFGTGLNTGTTGTFNYGFGNNVFNALTSGFWNLGFGYGALRALTTGQYNIGISIDALTALIIGSDNIGIGRRTLQSVTSGNTNLAIGSLAGFSVSGNSNYNILLGNYSAYGNGTSNLLGSGNVFIGNYAGNLSTGSTKFILANSLTGETNPIALISGDFSTGQVMLPTKPTLSISTYDILTRNTTTGNIETISPSITSGTTITLTTTGTSGAATLVGGVLNIPQYTGVGLVLNQISVAGTYNILTTDYYVDCSATTTTTLPTAIGARGQTYVITNTGVGTVTVATTGGQTINGNSTETLTTNNSITVHSNNSNWIIN